MSSGLLSPEKLFDLATAGHKWARLVIRITSWFWPAMLGLYEYRRGELTNALYLLQSSRWHTTTTRKYLGRVEEMCLILNGDAPHIPQLASKHKKYNGNVLFACHYSGAFDLNGYAIRTAQVARALRDEGVVIQASTRLGYPWDATGQKLPYEPSRSSFRGLDFEHYPDPQRRIHGREWEYIEAYAEQLKKKATQLNSTVIHAHSSYHNGLAAIIAARSIGIKSVYEVRGLWHLTRAVTEPDYQGSEHYRYFEKMEITAAREAGHVITIGPQLKCWLVDRGVANDKISVVPNCASAHRLPQGSSLSPANNKLKIGFVGSVTPYEGLDDLIEAIDILRSNGITVTLHIAGPINTLSRNLQRHVKKRGLSRFIHFFGELDEAEVAGFYKDLDLTAVLRKRNRLTELVPPFKVPESFAFGVPCLVSDLPPLRDILGPDLDRLIVSNGGAHAIAKQLTKLAHDPECLQKYRSKVIERARSRFSWDKYVSLYIGAYRT